jgi:hypothetical protein
VTDFEIPATGSAEQVPREGHAGLAGGNTRASGTPTMTIDGDAVILPGHGAPFRLGARA